MTKRARSVGNAHCFGHGRYSLWHGTQLQEATLEAFDNPNALILYDSLGNKGPLPGILSHGARICLYFKF